MALDTYAGQKAALKNWIKRGDLDSYIPDFIALSELHLARDLRLWGMETTATLSTVSAAANIPADMLEATRLSVVVANQVRPLLYVSAFQFANTQTYTGNPANYTTLNGQFVVSPQPVDGTELSLTYFAKPAALSDANQTNLWTQVAADALLYGALVEAMLFIKDENRATLWKQRYDGAVAKVQDTDERSQSAGPMRIRADNAR